MKLSSMIFSLDHNGLAIRNAQIDYLTKVGVPDEAVLTLVKERLMAAIDDKAEAIRSQIVTPGAGQAMEYQEAFTQASAADKAKSGLTPENYPMLAATIGIDIDPTTGQPATDVAGVARSILKARNAWVAFGSEIRRVRLVAKQAVASAETRDAAVTAFDNAEWPTIGA